MYIDRLYVVYMYMYKSCSLILFHSMRVLPHHQDTGGFFIAVLEKKDWLPWQRKQRRTQPSTTTETKVSTAMDDTVTSSDTDVIIVPKLKDLAYKATVPVEPEKVEENLSSTDGSASIDPTKSENTNNDSERTTQSLNSLKPEGNDGSIPGNEEVKKADSSDGQERSSKTVLGR